MQVNALFPEICFPSKEIDFFQREAKKLALDEGDYFLTPGTCCERIALINSGLLCTQQVEQRGQSVIVYHGENQFVFAFTSFITGEPSPWAIQALAPSRLTLISRQLFYQLLQRNPCWTEFWMKVLGTQIATLNKVEGNPSK